MTTKHCDLLKQFNTLCTEDMLRQLGITIVPREEMNKNKMDAMLFMYNRYALIFMKTNLEEAYAQFVLYHEIGHYLLHRGVGSQYSFYASRYKNRLESEANVFACTCLLQNEDIEDIDVISLLIHKGVPNKIAVQFYESQQQ